LRSTGLVRGELDLLAGGPPCQAFSIFGKRKGRDDPRGRLVDDYLRILVGLKPKAFIFENVFGLLTIAGGSIFNEIIARLSNPSNDLKYKLSVHRCNAADFGAPQFRDRIFIVGSIDGTEIEMPTKICANPMAKSHLLPWRTVGSGLEGLPMMGDTESLNHTGRKHSERIIERYGKMAFGERDHFTRINRLDPSRPSYAIIVGSDAGGGKGHVHPFEAREVTPRESARMQCFPDWWWFSGTSRHPIRQIGNAVPTLLGYAFGRTISQDLFGVKPTSYADAIDMLGQRHLFTRAELEFLAGFDRQDLSSPTKIAI
jgi:DNA (cytosine-5)-methyltransferase 1